MRGVTIAVIVFYGVFIISTHTPHARRDGMALQLNTMTVKFQLTRLMRGVT